MKSPVSLLRFVKIFSTGVGMYDEARAGNDHMRRTLHSVDGIRNHTTNCG